MTFLSYIERQKSLIRSRHEGETYLMQNGEVIRLSDSDRIFNEINSMEGLMRGRGVNKTARKGFADSRRFNIKTLS